MSQQKDTAAWRIAVLALAVTAVLGIPGCKKSPAPAPVASAPAENASPAPAASPATVETDADLLNKAKTAANDKRLYAPAGDNAIEYYLALRARNPNDASSTAALTDLMPYAIIATEQSLDKASATKDPTQAQGYRTEAARIFALLERVDANAPSLPRLREKMQKEAASELKAQQDAAKKTQDDLEKKTEADKAAAAAAKAASNSAAASPPQTTAQPVQTQPTQPAVTRPASTSQPATTQTPVAPPPPVASPVAPEPTPPKPAAHAGLPDVLSSVQPTYPREALRDGVSGEVTVAFTVNTDGSVSGASIVSSNPKRVFDTAALEAIRKWKFEAPAEPVSGHKTFAFNPGN